MLKVILDWLINNHRRLAAMEAAVVRIEMKLDAVAIEVDAIGTQVDANTVLLEEIREQLQPPEQAVSLSLEAGPVEEQPQ